MVLSFSVPITVTLAPACLSSVARAALSLVSRVYTLSPTTKAYFDPLDTQARVHPASSPAMACLAPHIESLTVPVKALQPAAKAEAARAAAKISANPSCSARDFIQ